MYRWKFIQVTAHQQPINYSKQRLKHLALVGTWKICRLENHIHFICYWKNYYNSFSKLFLRLTIT